MLLELALSDVGRIATILNPLIAIDTFWDLSLLNSVVPSIRVVMIAGGI